MARQAHPARDMVCQWLEKEDGSTQFKTAKEAAQRAGQQFEKEKISEATLYQWVKNTIPRFASKPRDSESKPKVTKASEPAPPLEVESFDDIEKGIQALHQKVIDALMKDEARIVELEGTLERLKSAQKENIGKATKMTGLKPSEIEAKLDEALNREMPALAKQKAKQESHCC